MERDIKRIIKAKKGIKQFLEYPHDRCHLIKDIQPHVLHGLMSMIKFTKNVLKHHHPQDYKKLMKEHGHHINHLLSSVNEHDNRNKLYEVSKMDKHDELRGGSFFGSIGHFFKKAADTVGHAFKKAGETVYNKAIKPAAKGIETVGKDIYHGVKDAGEWIIKNRKLISNVVNHAIGLLSVLPIPEVQEVAKALKPFVDQTNKIIQGTGLPQFLTSYPQCNLIKNAGIY
jgi:hypothetical protein